MSLDAIDALLAFLPTLGDPAFDPIVKWEGGESRDGVISMPYPTYRPEVEGFVAAIRSGGWIDYGYDPVRCSAIIGDDERLAIATLDEIRALLTYIVRSERFGDGNWGGLIQSGRVAAVLRRLAVIRDEHTSAS